MHACGRGVVFVCPGHLHVCMMPVGHVHVAPIIACMRAPLAFHTRDQEPQSSGLSASLIDAAIDQIRDEAPVSEDDYALTRWLEKTCAGFPNPNNPVRRMLAHGWTKAYVRTAAQHLPPLPLISFGVKGTMAATSGGQSGGQMRTNAGWAGWRGVRCAKFVQPK